MKLTCKAPTARSLFAVALCVVTSVFAWTLCLERWNHDPHSSTPRHFLARSSPLVQDVADILVVGLRFIPIPIAIGILIGRAKLAAVIAVALYCLAVLVYLAGAFLASPL